MKFIIKDNKGKTVKELNNYPNINMGDKLVGFDYDKFIIYVIVEDNRPAYDPDKEFLQKNEECTDIIYPGSHQIKMCFHRWEVLKHQQSVIIEKLNASLGNHLDEQYPIWERAKHAGEGTYILWDKSENKITQAQLDRKAYIDSVYAWITKCRTDRDKKETEFINKKIFPSFEWTDRP